MRILNTVLIILVKSYVMAEILIFVLVVIAIAWTIFEVRIERHCTGCIHYYKWSNPCITCRHHYNPKDRS